VPKKKTITFLFLKSSGDNTRLKFWAVKQFQYLDSAKITTNLNKLNTLNSVFLVMHKKGNLKKH